MKVYKIIVVIALLMISISPNYAQNPYISPGIRLSNTFGEGFSIGMEITIGVFGEITPYHFSLAVGNNWIIQKKKSISYIAGQGGYSLVGASIGKAYLLEKGEKSSGLRLSLYGGLGAVLLSYESMRFPDYHKQFNSFGVWGKLPIILKDERLWWLM